MSKSSGFFDDIKKDFKNIYKHGKKAVKGFSGGHRHEHDDDCGNCCSGYGGRRPRCFGGPPFFKPGRSPWFYILLCPKMCVLWLMLLVLLLCGVSLYGIIVIILLGIIFILI
ncbi:hypothetical protein HMPREF1084_02908 [Clostridium butyricum 60E.3]|nr:MULTISPECIES: hypothetical protein [Clostridium]AOR93267.1 hypothetical protein BBB49_03970 [Clostridium butyricum]APF23231.1 hypothetical protein NPD4_3020 [Clostridium butyricum]ENZ31389.1 hypothetical protein HMPREF1084_02908 [Clostridium butyricum 60E.3]MBA8965322.1 hypothetical protein [Clostridium butyricum]MBA8970121.1 hypothetical protein [Clostridium butyricum]